MSKIWRGLKALFSPPPARLSQKTIDAYRSSLLLSTYELAKRKNAQPTQEEADAIIKSVQEWSFETMSAFAQGEINKQILSMFHALEEHRKALDGGGESLAGGGASGYVTAVGFELERRQSSIPGAGQGVYLRIPPNLPQLLPAGTVLSLFPGQVHLPEYTRKRDYVKTVLLPDPEMMCVVRVDEPIIIDGRTAHLCPPNPYALAHLVNHCNTAPPNVLQQVYNFAGDPFDLDPHVFPRALRKFVPNAYARKPTLLGTTDRSAWMHGQVLLAARPLQDGDELLMDYRLSPSAARLPDWYRHYDAEQADNRWKDP